jgi:ABC-type multidrug transport system ATPase subunit
MNESILKALMRLFALVAYVNEKGQPSIERDVVYEYLQRQFSNELVEKYLKYFNKYLTEYHPDFTIIDDEQRHEQRIVNAKTVEKLCNKLNLELQQEQKIFIMAYLLDFISSGGALSSYQFHFIESVCSFLNISHSEYIDARYFTFGELENVQDKANLLLVNSKKGPKPKKIKQLYIDKLEGQLVVLRIPSTNTLILRYYGTQELLLNGHNIKINRSYIWAPGSVIKNSFFGSVYYIWVAGQFIRAMSQNPFVFTAKDIEFSYGNSPNGIKRFNLNEESGRLIGIIGGSGSGKSTLLKVLAGIIKPHHGEISINDYNIFGETDDLRGLIGYVPQDEFLIKELTVYENLYFNARFSFSHFSTEEIDKLVDKALLDFDLVEARDLRVGNALNTYLSGGQRKRLNVALELLREPAVLFIDEPTSGLSSSDSEKVMNLLKRQTFKGKLVFANIHQPSSEIFKLLDKLLVVDQGGRVIYYGNPLDAIGYFKAINHYVDADSSECLSCGNINSDQILRNIEARVVDVNGRLTRKRKTSPEEWYKMYMDHIDPIIRNIKRPFRKEIPKSDFKEPPRWQQIKLYFKRDLLSKLKNKQYLIVTLLESPVLALLLAFYTRSSRDSSGQVTSYFYGLNNNIPAYLFMAVIVAIFLGLVISAEEIFRDRRLLERERFLNLSRSSYLLSKTAIMFMISALQIILFVLVGNQILEIRDMTLRYFLILFSASAWANLVGLNISSGFKSVVTIYILVPIILVPQLLFSGVVVDFYNLNNSIQSYKYVPRVGDAMTSRWAYEAIAVTQYRDNPFEAYFFDSEQRMSDALYVKAYQIPEIVERLDEIRVSKPDSLKPKSTLSNLLLVRNELESLMDKSGIQFKIQPEEITLENFDDNMFASIYNYLTEVKSHYHSIYLGTLSEQDKIYSKLITRFGGKEKFLEFKRKYSNNQLANTVENKKEFLTYIVHDNQIIKLKEPIFTLPLSKQGRSHFYAPYKRFMNQYIDTYWYNMLRIWLSTSIFFIILYFDLLFKVIKYFENIRLRRFNRKITAALNKSYENKK